MLSLHYLHHAVTVTTDIVKRWIEDEKTIICSAEKCTSKFIITVLITKFILLTTVTGNWKPFYFTMLQNYYSTRLLWYSCELQDYLYLKKIEILSSMAQVHLVIV